MIQHTHTHAHTVAQAGERSHSSCKPMQAVTSLTRSATRASCTTSPPSARFTPNPAATLPAAASLPEHRHRLPTSRCCDRIAGCGGLLQSSGLHARQGDRAPGHQAGEHHAARRGARRVRGQPRRSARCNCLLSPPPLDGLSRLFGCEARGSCIKMVCAGRWSPKLRTSASRRR